MKKTNPKELLKFRADPILRRAIKLRGAFLDANLQDVIVEVLRTGLASEIEEVGRRGLLDSSPNDDPKKPARQKK